MDSISYYSMVTDSVLFESYPFPDEQGVTWLTRVLLARRQDEPGALVVAERPCQVGGIAAGPGQLPAVLEALATKLSADFVLHRDELYLMLSEQSFQPGLLQVEQLQQVSFSGFEREEYPFVRFRGPELQPAADMLRLCWPDVFLPVAVSSSITLRAMPRKPVIHQIPSTLDQLPTLEAILNAHRVTLLQARQALGIVDMRTLRARLDEPGRLTCAQVEQLGLLLKRPASELLQWILQVALPATEPAQFPAQGGEITCAQLKLVGELVDVPVDQLLQRILNVHILSA